MNEKEFFTFDDFSEELFAYAYIFKRISNIKKFKEWLCSFHKISDYKLIFRGYQIFLRFLLRRILYSLMHCKLPYLEEDVLFRRIKSDVRTPVFLFNDPLNQDKESISGIVFAEKPNDILDIPTSCNKMALIKALYNLEKQLKRKQKFNTLEKAIIEFEPFFDFLNNIYENSIFSNKKHSKEILLKLRSMKLLNNYFDEIDLTNLPRCNHYWDFFKISNITGLFYAQIVLGYVYTLQYSWYRLINEELFLRSKIKDIHQIIDSEYYDIINEKININKVKNYWLHIHGVYSSSNYSQILQFSLKKYNVNINDDFLKISNKIDEKNALILQNFIKKMDDKFPNNFKNKKPESVTKILDAIFLWLPIETLGFYGVSHFLGSNAFILMLKESLNNLNNDSTNLAIRIIKHPNNENPEHTTYSLAILPVFDDNQVQSCWVLFHSCLYAQSGYHQIKLDKILNEINDAKNKGINVYEFDIDAVDFARYVETRNITFTLLKEYQGVISSSVVYQDLRKKKAESKEILKGFQSKTLEYMVFKWLINCRNEARIKHGFTFDKYEYDCFLEQNNEIEIYECKLNIHDSDLDEKNGLAVDIQIKTDVLTKSDIFKEKNIKNFLIIWKEINPERFDYFKEKEIIVIDNFKEVVINNPEFKSERMWLLKIMDLDYAFQI